MPAGCRSRGLPSSSHSVRFSQSLLPYTSCQTCRGSRRTMFHSLRPRTHTHTHTHARTHARASIIEPSSPPSLPHPPHPPPPSLPSPPFTHTHTHTHTHRAAKWTVLESHELGESRTGGRECGGWGVGREWRGGRGGGLPLVVGGVRGVGAAVVVVDDGGPL